MKLVHRLAILVVCSVLGMIAMAGFGLNTLRTSMLEDRHNELRSVLTLAAKMVEHFQSLEKEGKLTREEAQAKAIEVLANLSDGQTKYVWARTTGALGLVLPANQATGIGKVDFGKKLPDGRFDFQRYLELLESNQFGFVELSVKKPGSDEILPKINGVTKVQGWDWVLGYGAWVDDIDAAFWRSAFNSIGLGVLLLLAVIGLAVAMARSIYRGLGGEPKDVTECMSKIASGDLGLEIVLKENDTNSLMFSLRKMQLKLVNITSTIQDNASTLADQVQDFDGVAKSYAETKSETDLFDLQRIVKKLGKTADTLGKSIARFRL
jgi:methyl-accepting chemotaxis protein